MSEEKSKLTFATQRALLSGGQGPSRTKEIVGGLVCLSVMQEKGTSPAFIKASVYLLVAWLCPHGLKPENLMREWAAQGKLFSFHVEKAQNQANKHLLIFSQ